MNKEKSEENGEELIDLDQDNNLNEKINHKKELINKPKKSYNKTTNKNKSNNILFIALLLILTLTIILLLLYLKKEQTNKNEKIKPKVKTLIIFDFDKTLTVHSVFEEQRFLLPTKEEQEDLIKRIKYEKWTSIISSFYDRIYDLNISISDIYENIDRIEYNPGMLELLKYLESHKDNYSLVIISFGHYIQVMRALEKYNLTKIFDEIVTIPSHIENGKIIITPGSNYNCDICNVGQCKTYEYKLIIDKFKDKNITFDRVYYICDGLSDLCLARNLKENDILLVRKDFTLYNALYKNGWNNNMTCVVHSWNDGYDIIDYLKNKEE